MGGRIAVREGPGKRNGVTKKTGSGSAEAGGEADAVHGGLGDGAGAIGAFAEDLVDVVEVVFEVGAALAHGFEVEPDGFEEAFFEVAVAGAAAAEVGFEGLDVGFRGDDIKQLVRVGTDGETR